MVQIIKNVQFVDGARRDIVVQNDRIVRIEKAYHGAGKMITVPKNVYVSAGWIDLHTHAFPKFEPYCSLPDDIGYRTGVTTVVDAGSTGYEDIAELNQVRRDCETRIFAFLNVSKVGLKIRDELSDMALLDDTGLYAAVKQYPEFIVGLKARMSASVIGENGIVPLQRAKQFSNELKLPLMVHIGSSPPELHEIFNYLEKGDIVTHCFHEKWGNHLFTTRQPNIQTAHRRAMDRGVYFDIGHGSSSFSFAIAKRAKAADIPFHSISTDIYEKNRKYGPVYNMATTLTKFLALGYPLKEVIQSVTANPANMIRKHDIGAITVGKMADLTFFSLEDNAVELIDSFGHRITANKKITPFAVMIGGKYMECKTNEIA